MKPQLLTMMTMIALLSTTQSRGDEYECYYDENGEEVCYYGFPKEEDPEETEERLAIVVDRRIYYSQSIVEKPNGADENPEARIDYSRVALVPKEGMEVHASDWNYTNYVYGINGIAIDIKNAGNISVEDFVFSLSNGTNDFSVTDNVPVVSVFKGGGLDGSDRVKLEFHNRGIKNTWLQVTILANSNSGLARPDTFYFGNAIGDVYAGNIGNPVVVRTNATDVALVRNNQGKSLSIKNVYDLNKDGVVNATDTSIVRQYQNSSIIKMFTVAPLIIPLEE